MWSVMKVINPLVICRFINCVCRPHHQCAARIRPALRPDCFPASQPVVLRLRIRREGCGGHWGYREARCTHAGGRLKDVYMRLCVKHTCIICVIDNADDNDVYMQRQSVCEMAKGRISTRSPTPNVTRRPLWGSV